MIQSAPLGAEKLPDGAALIPYESYPALFWLQLICTTWSGPQETLPPETVFADAGTAVSRTVAAATTPDAASTLERFMIAS